MQGFVLEKNIDNYNKIIGTSYAHINKDYRPYKKYKDNISMA